MVEKYFNSVSNILHSRFKKDIHLRQSLNIAINCWKLSKEQRRLLKIKSDSWHFFDWTIKEKDENRTVPFSGFIVDTLGMV
jgi:hypothetical protein